MAIPSVEAIGYDSARYFTLNVDYRKRFLIGTGISESDKVVVYDYANDVSATFVVKNLPVVASLNIYAGLDDWVFSQRDYKIGFGIDSVRLKNMNRYYRTTLVTVGKEDPFIQMQMKAIMWEKVDYKDIPFSTKDLNKKTGLSRFTAGNTYKFETDEYRYLVQDLIQTDIIDGRHLHIIDLKTNQQVCDRLYFDREGTSLAPINNISPEYGNMTDQWTGNLFKNKAPIVFGFLYQSFECPGITFLDNSETIYILVAITGISFRNVKPTN